MAHQLNRHDVAAWLLRNGFTEKGRKSTGHRHFTHAASGVKIALPGHGPNDLTKRIAGNVVRALVRAGFDRERVRAELHAWEAA